MAPRQKRLLLAVDGSERAKLTVRYAGEEDAFKWFTRVARIRCGLSTN